MAEVLRRSSDSLTATSSSVMFQMLIEKAETEREKVGKKKSPHGGEEVVCGVGFTSISDHSFFLTFFFLLFHSLLSLHLEPQA